MAKYCWSVLLLVCSTFLTSSQTITNCTSNCANCSPPDNCASCKSGYYINTNTPIGKNQCYSCVTNCKTCNNTINCIACMSGYRLSSSKQCEPCNVTNCSVCNTNKTSC